MANQGDNIELYPCVFDGHTYAQHCDQCDTWTDCPECEEAHDELHRIDGLSWQVNFWAQAIAAAARMSEFTRAIEEDDAPWWFDERVADALGGAYGCDGVWWGP